MALIKYHSLALKKDFIYLIAAENLLLSVVMITGIGSGAITTGELKTRDERVKAGEIIINSRSFI